MGGNATLEYNTKRITKENYDKIIHYLNNFLKEEIFSKNEELFGFPLSYKNKESHGDIDLLTSMYLPQLLSKLIKNKEIVVEPSFLNKKIQKNGDVKINSAIESIPVKIVSSDLTTDYFQLDLININKQDFETAYHYYCFNDLGNMIGRIAYGEGLRFGQDGLYYVFPYEHEFTKILGKTKIYISNDYFKILQLLDFKDEDIKDRESFYNKFYEKEDVYNFILNNKNFTPYVFLNTFKNSKAKMRDNKRKVLNDFVELLINKGFVTRYEAYEASEEELPFKQKDGLLKIQEFIKNGEVSAQSISDQLNKIKNEMEKKLFDKKYNKKFSGEIVINILKESFEDEINAMNNKQLGDFISKMKGDMLDYFKENNFTKEDVVKMDEEIIKEKILFFIKQNLNKPQHNKLKI